MKTYAHDMGTSTRFGVRVDGSAGSGNWGHVGRPGEIGGSTTGGGIAFRGEAKTKWMKAEIGQYCSQAKIRKNTMLKLNSSSARVRAQGVKHAQMFNMEQKSYKNVTNFDPNASQNILKDAKRSNISKKFGVQGTKEMRDYTLSHTLTAQQAGNIANAKGATQVQTLKSVQTKANAQKGTKSSSSKNSSQSQNNNQNNNAHSAKPNAIAPGTSTEKTTGRPVNNPNYQKALAAAGDPAAQKAFYKEAKANGSYNSDPRGGNYSDTQSSDNGNVQKLINYMGLTGKPTKVDKATFKKLAAGREDQVIFRGSSSPVGTDQFKNGDCNRMGGIAYGTGVYFGGSNDGTFRTSCGYHDDIKALPKEDAKILVVDGSGRDANGKQWSNRDGRGNTQYTSAIISGYDAVRIKGAGGGRGSFSSPNGGDYIVVWNREAFVVED